MITNTNKKIEKMKQELTEKFEKIKKRAPKNNKTLISLEQKITININSFNTQARNRSYPEVEITEEIAEDMYYETIKQIDDYSIEVENARSEKQLKWANIIVPALISIFVTTISILVQIYLNTKDTKKIEELQNNKADITIITEVERRIKTLEEKQIQREQNETIKEQKRQKTRSKKR